MKRLIVAVLVALTLAGCCSMSRRPIPGICATASELVPT
jgi:hypothetical protein